MYRRHTTPATSLPPPGPSMIRDAEGGSHRPRQFSAVRMRALSLPKTTTHHRLISADAVPWDRSLRSSQPTYIAGPGFAPTRRSSSNAREHLQHHYLPEIRLRAVPAASALPAVVPTPSPPPMASGGAARRRSSAAYPRSPLNAKDVSTPAAHENGLSTSLAEVSPFAEPSRRRPSSHQHRPLRFLLGADARDEAAALTAYTSPNAVIFAAYDTLRLLLIPLWRRYRRRKQTARATATVAKFVLAKVRARRLRRRECAADALLCVLRAPRTRLLCAVREVGVQVVRIQRAFRLHRRSVHAVVELNYRKVRRDVEQAYWAAVVAQRETELAAQQPQTSAVAKAVQEVLEAKRDVLTRFGTVRRTSVVSTANVVAAPVPASYELDVYNYYMIGRLPETILRFEIASAVFAHTQRSASRACLLDDLCTPKHRRSTDAGRSARSTTSPLRRGSRAPATKAPYVAHLPHLLSDGVYTSILNNTCYVTSLMRDDAMLRAHLKPRGAFLEPY